MKKDGLSCGESVIRDGLSFSENNALVVVLPSKCLPSATNVASAKAGWRSTWQSVAWLRALPREVAWLADGWNGEERCIVAFRLKSRS